MHEVSFTGSIIHSARTAGGGAGWAVAIGGSSGGTCVLAAEPSGEHDAEHCTSPLRGNSPSARTFTMPAERKQDAEHQHPLRKT